MVLHWHILKHVGRIVFFSVVVCIDAGRGSDYYIDEFLVVELHIDIGICLKYIFGITYIPRQTIYSPRVSVVLVHSCFLYRSTFVGSMWSFGYFKVIPHHSKDIFAVLIQCHSVIAFLSMINWPMVNQDAILKKKP